MKKLLSILGALAFTASVGSTVVACGTGTSKKSKLKDHLDFTHGNDAVITIGEKGHETVIRVKDFNKNDANDYILNQINKMVADKYASDYNETTIAGKGNLDLLNANNNFTVQGGNANGYASEIDNFNFTSIATDLYQTYVNAYPTTKPLDEQQYYKYGLNPSWYGDLGAVDNNGRFTIWYQSKGETNFKRWASTQEMTRGLLGDSSHSKDYLPTSDDLNNGKFFLVYDKDGKIPSGKADSKITDKSQLTAESIDALQKLGEIKERGITGQQALMYRFQNYLQTKDTSSMINAFTMEYAKNNLYKLQSAPSNESGTSFEKAANKSLYIDSSSKIAKDIQSWSTKSTDKITSNYKMVWRIAANEKDYTAVNEAISGLIRKPNTVENQMVSKDFAIFDNSKSFKDIYSTIISALTDKKNLAKKGSDPFFDGTELGYQGITKDGKAIDGGALNLNDSLSDKIKNSEGFGILRGNDTTAGKPTYNMSPKDGTGQDFVIVMPLYLMDLLRDGTAPKEADAPATPTATSLVNIARNNWIELKPQVGTEFSSKDKITAATGFEEYKPDNKDLNVLPDKSSYCKAKDGKSYIFIANNESNDSNLSVTANGKTISISPAKDSDDYSGYGIKGIFSTDSTDEKDKDAQALNGQTVNYKIHLGLDRNTPTSYEDQWLTSHKSQVVNDVANLSNAKKTDLMNTLFALAAKNDSDLVEETKSTIYRNYISLDDIFYKPLYDSLSKYLKEDDSTDDSD